MAQRRQADSRGLLGSMLMGSLGFMLGFIVGGVLGGLLLGAPVGGLIGGILGSIVGGYFDSRAGERASSTVYSSAATTNTDENSNEKGQQHTQRPGVSLYSRPELSSTTAQTQPTTTRVEAKAGAETKLESPRLKYYAKQAKSLFSIFMATIPAAFPFYFMFSSFLNGDTTTSRVAQEGTDETQGEAVELVEEEGIGESAPRPFSRS